MDKQTKRVIDYVRLYANEHGEPFDREPETAIVDFVTDLRHLAAWVGADWDRIERYSEIHQHRETRHAIHRTEDGQAQVGFVYDVDEDDPDLWVKAQKEDQVV